VTRHPGQRSIKRPPANEASICRPITGTRLHGSNIFRTFCRGNQNRSNPAKVESTTAQPRATVNRQ